MTMDPSRQLDPSTARSIQTHMEIRTQDGETLGQVDRLEGDYIKVTRDTDGQHHWIPASMIARVDAHVHLNVNLDEARQGWLDQNPGGQA
ncbi:hypothetical protein HNR42_000802 [Deinobacterium chartae]|uniref:DUF2171 domain-containing protein n=1 Tax=Deinobacterium chartae TaxID=521158 RepID=A0A841HZG2_9DEIO|nr:DUF2171 domain-containing protein [Deinobacterium chartae]MBB6097388.1 hypothetical protein [Deinobacterium chartae]